MSNVPLPEGMKFKQLKIQLQNSKWKKYRGVNSEKRLNELIDRNHAKNVYNSVSSWSDTAHIENIGYVVADRILLGTQIPFDFDQKMFIDKAFKNEEDALKMAEEESFKVKDFIDRRWNGLLTFKEHKFSGGGYHLIYDVFFPPIPHPADRIKYHVNFRKIVAESLENEGFVFDKPVTLDLFRVIRMTGTFNGNKNNVCTLHARTKDSLGSMTKSSQRETPSEFSDIRGGTARLVDKRPSSPSIYRFIDAKLDNKHYVPFLVLKPTQRSLHLLKYASELYGHKFYVYKDEKNYLALSTRLVDFRRYQRILRQTKALNERTVIKYGHARIRITSVIEAPLNERTPYGIELIPKPTPVTTIGTDKNGFHSKKHFELVSKDFAVLYEPALFLDKWNVKTKMAVVA